MNCTISDGNTTCTDLADSAAFAAGDLISIQVNPVSNPDNQNVRWTARFQGS